jgi:hypothetical protein
MFVGALRGIFSVEDMPGWPAIFPPFLSDAMWTTPSGDVLVRRARLPASRTTSLDIIDRTGRLSGRVTLDVNEDIVGVGRNYIYVIADLGGRGYLLSRRALTKLISPVRGQSVPERATRLRPTR